jgi:hypothetical protein
MEYEERVSMNDKSEKNIRVFDTAMQGYPDADKVLSPYFMQQKFFLKPFYGKNYCDKIERFGFIIRADGVNSGNTFNFEGVEKLSYRPSKKYISIDVGFPVSRWKDKSEREIKEYWVKCFREAINQMLAYLKKKKVKCDEESILKDFNQALNNWLETSLTIKKTKKT